MRLISSFLIFNILCLSCFAEIPDIKKLWNKYDNNISDKVTVKTQGDLEKAQEYVNSGDYEKALEIYEKSLNQNVNSSHIHTAIGYCFEKMGEYEKAILLYNKAVNLTPVDPAAFNNLAFIIAKTAISVEDVLPAINLAEKALKYRKDELSFLKTRLFVLKKAELWDKWEKEAVDFLKLYPNIVDINLELGEHYLQKKDIINARLYLNRALPDSKAVKLLSLLPEENRIVSTGKVNEKKEEFLTENSEKQIAAPEIEEVSADFMEFSKDYKIKLKETDIKDISLHNGKEKEPEKKSEDISGLKEDISVQPGILNLRLAYDDDFDKGLSNYNHGYYENALSYFIDYFDYCMKNKIYNEKLSRSAKYIGLINTKFGKDNGKYWDLIDFIDECVFIEKIYTMASGKNKEEYERLINNRGNIRNREDFLEVLNYKITVSENNRKSLNDIINMDFIFSSADLKNISAKSAELFSQAYKNLMETKPTVSEKFLRLAISEDPQNYLAYINLGIFYIKIDDYTSAYENIRTAVLRCPYDSVIYKDIRLLYNIFILYYI